MTILSGLIAVFNRLLGSAATATVGWATVMLFGRVSQKKQTLLSLIALGSLVWIVAVVAVVVPAIGGALITSVPRPGFVSVDWLRFALLAIAVALPLGIGLATVTAADDEDRPKGVALVVQILRGYLITPVLGGTILFLAAVSVIRQARAMQKGWDDAHIPIIVKPGRYDSVADDIESALRESGLEITRKHAPRTLELPPRLLMLVGGGSADRQFPDELVEFDADELNIILYPYDVLIVGRQASVVRARAAIARRLAFADAYLTTAEESEQVEDRLVGISKQGHVSAADFRPIDDLLTRLAVPQGDWETLYRLRLQVEHETRLPGATGPADGS
jgi:hypothetical protein